MDIAIGRKGLMGGASKVALVLLVSATLPAQGPPDSGLPKMSVLHATVTITGGVAFTGTYEQRLTIPTCAEVAKGGTNPPSGLNKALFQVPEPPNNTSGNGGPVGGGHTFSSDVAAYPYHGPGTYTGSSLSATQMDADTPPNSQETHIFAFPTGIGTLIVKPDASGSFEFHGLEDPGSVKISGSVVWTCS